MNKKLIRECLEDYLETLYRCGKSKQQEKVEEAIRELINENENS